MSNINTQVDSLYIELGQRVSLARKKINLTQEQLGDAVGLTRTSITNLEKGRQKALLHTVYGLAEALQIPVTDLLPPQQRRTHLDKLAPEQQQLILKAIPEFREKVTR